MQTTLSVSCSQSACGCKPSLPSKRFSPMATTFLRSFGVSSASWGCSSGSSGSVGAVEAHAWDISPLGGGLGNDLGPLLELRLERRKRSGPLRSPSASATSASKSSGTQQGQPHSMAPHWKKEPLEQLRTNQASWNIRLWHSMLTNPGGAATIVSWIHIACPPPFFA